MNISPEYWDLIRIFREVGRTGSLSKASRSLGISQPTIGRKLDQLESMLGGPVLLRHPRGVTPTDRGTELLAMAERIAEQVALFEQAAMGRRDALEGAVRISSTEPIAHTFLAPFARHWRQEQPGIHLELILDNRASDFATREADIAVRMFEPTQAELIAKTCGASTVALYAHRDYLARRGRPEELEDLFAHDMIGFDQDRLQLDALAALPIPVSREDFVIRSDSMSAHVSLVLAGAGIAGLHVLMAAQLPDVERVVPLFAMPFHIWLVMPRKLRASGLVRETFKALERHLKDALASGEVN